MFTAVLFTVARIWKPPKCPLLNEWIKVRYTHKYTYRHVHTMAYYSPIKTRMK